MNATRFHNRLAGYFGPAAGRVVVAETFTDGAGWQGWPRYRKQITVTWARKLRAAGVTHVQLAAGGRRADFSIAELLSTRTA